MVSNFDKHGEEAKTHSLVEKSDDASVWGMTKERVLALPHRKIHSPYSSFFMNTLVISRCNNSSCVLSIQ